MNATSGFGGAYVDQHRSVSEEIVERVREETGHRYAAELVFCSRSGPPGQPWLEPDVGRRISELAELGVAAVVVVPVGFVADHVEVVYDLDTEARAVADKVGVAMVRAATAGLDPRFVAMVRELLLERAAVERGRQPARAAVGDLGPSWDVCPPGCCANPRGRRPALCGRD
jgi:ferrochelatase